MRTVVSLSSILLLSILVESAILATTQPNQGLVGKWKVVKSQGNDGGDPGTIQFLKDGRIIISQKNSPKKNGSYSIDNTTSPATIMVKILIDDAETQQKVLIDCPGIYKFDGKRLIMKIVNAPKTSAPKDFTLDKDGYSNLELIR
jgi:uncharacterized protein (TIGR03067 family)